MSIIQISESMIEEKKAELLTEYVNDDSYLNDALCDCFAEIRAIYSSVTIDDKLAAVDVFQDKLSKSIKNNDVVTNEALEFYKNQIARG